MAISRVNIFNRIFTLKLQAKYRYQLLFFILIGKNLLKYFKEDKLKTEFIFKNYFGF